MDVLPAIVIGNAPLESAATSASNKAASGVRPGSGMERPSALEERISLRELEASMVFPTGAASTIEPVGPVRTFPC